MNRGAGDKPRGCLKSYSIMAFVDLQISQFHVLLHEIIHALEEGMTIR